MTKCRWLLGVLFIFTLVAALFVTYAPIKPLSEPSDNRYDVHTSEPSPPKTLAPGLTPEVVDGTGLFEVSYPNAGPLDWLTGKLNCRLVQVADIGTADAGTASYLWDYGDGTSERTDQPVVRHRYEEGAYTLLITTFNETGTAIATYFLVIQTFGNECSIRLFAKYATFPTMFGAIGYAWLGASLLFSSKPARKRLGRRFLFVAGALMVAFFIALSVSRGQIYLPGLP